MDCFQRWYKGVLSSLLVVNLIIFFVVIGYLSVYYKQCKNLSNYPVDYIVHGSGNCNITSTSSSGLENYMEWKELNSSGLCEKLSQFQIPGSRKIVSVCLYQNNSRVDIREFWDNKPGIRGVWLTSNEWRYLVRFMYDISYVLFSYM